MLLGKGLKKKRRGLLDFSIASLCLISRQFLIIFPGKLKPEIFILAIAIMTLLFHVHDQQKLYQEKVHGLCVPFTH